MEQETEAPLQASNDTIGRENVTCDEREPLEEVFLRESFQQCKNGRALVKDLLLRLDQGRAALQDTAQLLKGVAGAEGAYAKAYKKLGKESLSKGEGPTLKNATEAVCAYAPEVAK
ncbi:hypothetical protein KFL_000020600 [Klebsormidium nitens]|uniref:Uncharacterized protein n=1 Tax=Klebsormidium nitens TaxID=105231 RepID=A0A1Y1HPD6_KLENI|nr:hypothetical protein KFL_000020600 [Klebsormidium nitens]|eukprot:GAQ77698.1 hypothetical protein KFL_000020600 [Klebsormidium nitens]